MTPSPATAADYRRLQHLFGTTRDVIVTPSAYRIHNRCLLDAMQQMDASARVIAVVNSTITDIEFDARSRPSEPEIAGEFGLQS